MRKKVGIVKRLFTLLLIFLISINSFAAIVSDNDGSAFITKAEFDALKSSFQDQIDSYNTSIDSKIDGAIASYLAGMQLQSELQIYVEPSKNYEFVNYMSPNSFKDDQGLLALSHTRISRVYGLTAVNTTIGGNYEKMWEDGTNRYVCMTIKYRPTQTTTVSIQEWIQSVSFVAGIGTVGNTEIRWESNAAIFTTDVTGATNATTLNNLLWNKISNYWLNLGFAVTDTIPNHVLYNAWEKEILPRLIKSGEQIYYRANGTNKYITGIAAGIQTSTPVDNYKNDSNVYNLNQTDTYGVGWGVNRRNSIPYLSNFFSKASVMNTFNFQEFSYDNISSSHTSSTAWNIPAGGSTTNKTKRPTANWDRQTAGTERALSYTGTSDSSYNLYQATRLQSAVDSYWSDTHQLGTNSYQSSLKCFDESCPLVSSSDYTVSASTLQFTRPGYYLDSSNNLQTKTDNTVSSAGITYRKLLWKSEDLAPSAVALDSISSMSNEITYLGGGIPVAYASSETSGSKVKLDFTVQKTDGTALTSADGSMTIYIILSNKQFKNGAVDTGAQNLGQFSKSITYSTATGNWTSPAFNMAEKSKVWINAYVAKQGYKVVLSNVTAQ